MRHWRMGSWNALKSLGLAALMLLPSCATVHNVDVQLEESKPVTKITSYSKALSDLGTMTEIYGTPQLKIQSKEITDKTGASGATGAEIQANISEIVKSSLNSIGGNAVYIDYDPEFVNNMKVLGYSEFGDKLIPDVVLSGAITEFDRGLLTREKGTDVGAEVDLKGLPSFLPSSSVAVDMENSNVTSKSRITLDFNLKNFQTLSGISKRSIVNSMEVSKGVAKREVGVTIFGPTFGAKGSVKKVQGRHEAVRLLVELSMIQMVGRHLGLPYWRLLGEDAAVDDVVMGEITREFRSWDEEGKIINIQSYLYLHGYDVDLTGNQDGKTTAALRDLTAKYNLRNNLEDVYKHLYFSLPLDEETLNRRSALNRFLAAGQEKPVALPPADIPQQPRPQPADIPKPPPPQVADIPQQPRPQPHPETPRPEGSKYDRMTAKEREDEATRNIIQAGNFFRQRDYEKAALFFEEALKAKPSPAIYYYLALCYQGESEEGKAMKTLEEGTRSFPGDFFLWKSLGMIYSQKGNADASRQAFNQALALKPEDRQVRFFLEQMK